VNDASRNELTLHQHALQEIDAVAAGLADLTKKYKGAVFDVSTTAGLEAAKKARAEIREPRYEVERIRKAKGSELKKIATAINDRAGEITLEIRQLEDPIDAQVKAEEDRKEAEREARRKAEEARIQAQQDALASIAAVPGKLLGADAAQIDAAAQQLQGWDMGCFDEVFLPSAEQARADALTMVQKALEQREELDRQAEALREQQAELERQRQAQAAREAEEAAARRQQQEREDAERRARLEQEDRERAERLEAERREQAITAEIDGIRRQAFVPGASAEQLQAVISTLAAGGPLTADTYGVRVQEAEAARAEALDTLTARMQAARQQEEQAAQLQAQQEAAKRDAQERAQREQEEREAQAERDRQARAQAEAEASRRAAMLYVVTMPDGSRWAVPLMVIATDRARHYAREFDGDVERSLAEDTLPLFASDPYQVHDWAANNMNWSDVVHAAEQLTPPEATDYQEGWINGDYAVVIKQEKQA